MWEAPRPELVSIHASPQRQGELWLDSCFHSQRICFNPRLTSAARRTGSGARSPHSTTVSIHASPQRQGEQKSTVKEKPGKSVSIHASPQRQGELRQCTN